MRTLGLKLFAAVLDEAGTREPTIQRQGEGPHPDPGARHRLCRGVESADRDHRAVDLSPGCGCHVGSPTRCRTRATRFIRRWKTPAPNYEVEQTPVVTGDQLVDASAAMDPEQSPGGEFPLQCAGRAGPFGLYTAENIGSPFAIVLDGEVVSAP